VRLDVLDLRGRVVRTLVNERQAQGRSYVANWDGRDASGQRVASGMYMSRLRVNGDEQARIMTLVK
jgi:flagellar hook assembly protein FlgD